ncbi:hypothetical protein ATCC90586_008227 [Pythium insidiosum]|nr:hypothetical protein ATCC90586_008227 [Pythium insidiosum]
MSAHWTEKVKTYAMSKAVILEKVPPRYTFCCQPADVAWNKPLKDRLRRRWFDHMRDSMRTSQRVTQPTKADAMQWLSAAWNDLSDTAILNGFRKVGLTANPSTVTESDNDNNEAVMVADPALVAALERARALTAIAGSVDTELNEDEVVVHAVEDAPEDEPTLDAEFLDEGYEVTDDPIDAADDDTELDEVTEVARTIVFDAADDDTELNEVMEVARTIVV